MSSVFVIFIVFALIAIFAICMALSILWDPQPEEPPIPGEADMARTTRNPAYGGHD
jgi:hypothetical protein